MSQAEDGFRKRHLVFETERLRLTVATEDDVELFYALWTDARVMRIGEDTYQVPESKRGYATPVHHYIYRVYGEKWESG